MPILVPSTEQTAALPRRNAHFDDEFQECKHLLNDDVFCGELFNLDEFKYLLDVGANLFKPLHMNMDYCSEDP